MESEKPALVKGGTWMAYGRGVLAGSANVSAAKLQSNFRKLCCAVYTPPEPRAAAHGHTMAADDASNGSSIDRTELRQALVTSSTKRRLTELVGLQHQVEDDSES
jgi:hypothetical protein